MSVQHQLMHLHLPRTEYSEQGNNPNRDHQGREIRSGSALQHVFFWVRSMCRQIVRLRRTYTGQMPHLLQCPAGWLGYLAPRVAPLPKLNTGTLMPLCLKGVPINTTMTDKITASFYLAASRPTRSIITTTRMRA